MKGRKGHRESDSLSDYQHHLRGGHGYHTTSGKAARVSMNYYNFKNYVLIMFFLYYYIKIILKYFNVFNMKNNLKNGSYQIASTSLFFFFFFLYAICLLIT